MNRISLTVNDVVVFDLAGFPATVLAFFILWVVVGSLVQAIQKAASEWLKI